MDLVNNTPYAARLFHGHLGAEEKCAWVIARATFRYDPERGALAPSDDPWPVFDQALETAVGLFPSDNVFVREGCDVVVVGDVRLDREVTRHTVRVRAGAFSNELAIFGDRVWQRSMRGPLTPSSPLPFREMTLDWRRSYGGTTSYQSTPAPHFLNPAGMGLYWSEDDARERPLPNVEDPAKLIARWEDRPMPAGWGPITNAPTWHATRWFMDRAERGAGEPSHDEIASASLGFFEGAATPAMIAPSLAPGDLVELTGLSPKPTRFTVPDLALRVSSRVGDDLIERSLSYSGLWVIAQHDLVALTARANFRYPFRPRERRGATLDVISRGASEVNAWR
ncbi:MAG: DUF2169 domain-containing protein [Polyangiales bacterium]